MGAHRGGPGGAMAPPEILRQFPFYLSNLNFSTFVRVGTRCPTLSVLLPHKHRNVTNLDHLVLKPFVRPRFAWKRHKSIVFNRYWIMGCFIICFLQLLQEQTLYCLYPFRFHFLYVVKWRLKTNSCWTGVLLAIIIIISLFQNLSVSTLH